MQVQDIIRKSNSFYTSLSRVIDKMEKDDLKVMPEKDYQYLCEIYQPDDEDLNAIMLFTSTVSLNSREDVNALASTLFFGTDEQFQEKLVVGNKTSYSHGVLMINGLVYDLSCSVNGMQLIDYIKVLLKKNKKVYLNRDSSDDQQCLLLGSILTSEQQDALCNPHGCSSKEFLNLQM